MAFRADAAVAKPEICDALEQRGVDYAIRMRFGGSEASRDG